MFLSIPSLHANVCHIKPLHLFSAKKIFSKIFRLFSKSFSGFLSLSVSVVLLCFLHRNVHFFCLQKKKFPCLAPRTTRFKFKKIERKVTESQKIKNKLAEIWTFWISGAQFPIFYSFIPHSTKYEKTSLSLDPKSPNFFASMLIVIFVCFFENLQTLYLFGFQSDNICIQKKIRIPRKVLLLI